jgi:hypothetical protein
MNGDQNLENPQTDPPKVIEKQYNVSDAPAAPAAPVPEPEQDVVTTVANQPAQTPPADEASLFHPETEQGASASDIHAVEHDGDVAVTPSSTAMHDPLAWTSSGAVSGQKSKSWYAGLLVGAVAIAALVYLISKDTVSAGAVVLAAVLFGAFSIKKPHAVHYVIDNIGITVGQKHFIFTQFRSFSVVDEGNHTSIVLSPLKRFSPLLSLSYDPQLQEQIVGLLAEHLPVEAHKKDAFDKITSSIKF